MSGYWHDVNHTSVSTYPAGSLLHGYDVPVGEDCVALALAGDEVTVIEGEKADMPVAEVLALFDLDQKTYDTARRRLRRQVDKLMPGRRQR